MAKAKSKASDIPGAPLPQHFHPKDSPCGIIARTDIGIGAGPDTLRKTVHISIGGSRVEMTPEAAQRFVDQIVCAISCALGKSDV